MKAIYETSHLKKEIDLKGEEESCALRQIAEIFFFEDNPSSGFISLTSEEGNEMKIEVKEESSLNKKEEGLSFHLRKDSLYLKKSLYAAAKLRHVDGETNQRFRCDLNPNNLGERTISIGSILGEIGKKGHDKIEDGMVQSPFPSQLYWFFYYEKLHRGYKDFTEDLKRDEDENSLYEFLYGKKETQVSKEEMQDSDASELYSFFMDAAQSTLRASGIELNFYRGDLPYTKRQVTSVKKILNKMYEAEKEDAMNACVEDLIAIASPKYEKGKSVADYFVKPYKDEEEKRKKLKECTLWANQIVSSMEAVISLSHSKTEIYESPFGNIKVHKENAEEMEKTLRSCEPKINAKQRDSVIAVFDIEPIEQRKLYDAYREKMFLNKETYLFHGSPNCNWISIIKNSLMTRPNAKICGKAFGNGIYFAPDSDKSAGYTSNRGSRYRAGEDDICAMGIFRVATGKTFDNPSVIGAAKENTDRLLSMFEKKGFDSLWYHAGGQAGFVRDEVVVYHDEACCLYKILLYRA